MFRHMSVVCVCIHTSIHTYIHVYIHAHCVAHVGRLYTYCVLTPPAHVLGSFRHIKKSNARASYHLADMTDKILLL